MAIDTAEKRKSASGIQVSLVVGVTPNASQDAEWRQEAGWGYPGIAASAPASASPSLAAHITEATYKPMVEATYKSIAEAD